MQVPAVEEVVHPLVVAVECLRLGALIVVVGELQVPSTGVDVHVVAEDIRRHNGALNVPTRAALSPRRGPSWLTRLRELPQGEVIRRTLFAVHRLRQRALTLRHLRFGSGLIRASLQLGIVVACLGKGICVEENGGLCNIEQNRWQ